MTIDDVQSKDDLAQSLVRRLGIGRRQAQQLIDTLPPEDIEVVRKNQYFVPDKVDRKKPEA